MISKGIERMCVRVRVCMRVRVCDVLVHVHVWCTFGFVAMCLTGLISPAANVLVVLTVTKGQLQFNNSAWATHTRTGDILQHCLLLKISLNQVC